MNDFNDLPLLTQEIAASSLGEKVEDDSPGILSLTKYHSHWTRDLCDWKDCYIANLNRDIKPCVKCGCNEDHK